MFIAFNLDLGAKFQGEAEQMYLNVHAEAESRKILGYHLKSVTIFIFGKA